MRCLCSSSSTGLTPFSSFSAALWVALSLGLAFPLFVPEDPFEQHCSPPAVCIDFSPPIRILFFFSRGYVSPRPPFVPLDCFFHVDASIPFRGPSQFCPIDATGRLLASETGDRYSFPSSTPVVEDTRSPSSVSPRTRETPF